jgi:uncharacterized protein
VIALLVGAGLLTVCLVVGVRFLEPKLAFFPTAGETATPRDLGVPFEASTITTRDGERLRVWTMPHPDPLAIVVYFHGNGGNLSVWSSILAAVQRQRFTVIAFDYRGYGASTGRPSEHGVYRDVDAIVASDLVATTRGNRDATPLVYWGRSLGATIAAYAATIRQPDGVILESGFPDARSLIRSSPPMMFLSLFSTYRFPTADFMAKSSAPVLVMHGDSDSVIPYPLGQALFARINGPKQFVTLHGADHNDQTPPDAAAYWNTIGSFVASIAKARVASRPQRTLRSRSRS